MNLAHGSNLEQTSIKSKQPFFKLLHCSMPVLIVVTTHNPNSTSTQPKLYSTEFGLTHRTPPTTTPPPSPKLNFHHKESQINL